MRRPSLRGLAAYHSLTVCRESRERGGSHHPPWQRSQPPMDIGLKTSWHRNFEECLIVGLLQSQERMYSLYLTTSMGGFICVLIINMIMDNLTGCQKVNSIAPLGTRFP